MHLEAMQYGKSLAARFATTAVSPDTVMVRANGHHCCVASASVRMSFTSLSSLVFKLPTMPIRLTPTHTHASILSLGRSRPRWRGRCLMIN